jgi:GNAT superfamily N-acetyltransferase
MKKEFTLRTALPGDGLAIFHVTRQSITELSNGLYTPEFYEQLIKQGQMVVALQLGRIVGFVDSEPGEVTRLFLLLEASSKGLGTHLLKTGIDNARGPGIRVIKVESTLNAEGLYKKHGFVTQKHGFFSHGVGGQPIEIIHMELELE